MTRHISTSTHLERLELVSRWSSTELNLGSNELLHAELPYLASETSRGEISLAAARYPRHQQTLSRLQAELGDPWTHATLTPGSTVAIHAVLNLLSRRGIGHAVLQHPNFVEFESAADLCGMSKQYVKSAEATGDGWLDLLVDAASCLPVPAVVCMSFPNSPLGKHCTPEHLKQSCQRLLAAGHTPIIDLCYWEFAETEFGAPDLPDEVVTIKSLSKILGLAGARAALVAGDGDIIRLLERQHFNDAVSTWTLLMIHQRLDRLNQLRGIWRDLRSSRRRLAVSMGTKGFCTPPTFTNFLVSALPPGLDAMRALRLLADDGIRVKDASHILHRPAIRYTVGDAEITARFEAAIDDVLRR